MVEGKTLKEQVKDAENELLDLKIAKAQKQVKKLRDENRMRDSAGRVIRKTIRDPRGQILSKGSEDED